MLNEILEGPWTGFAPAVKVQKKSPFSKKVHEKDPFLEKKVSPFSLKKHPHQRPTWRQAWALVFDYVISANAPLSLFGNSQWFLSTAAVCLMMGYNVQDIHAELMCIDNISSFYVWIYCFNEALF